MDELNFDPNKEDFERPGPPPTFQRFTEKCIRALIFAQQEAKRLGHNFVGTEQLLLGLMDEETGIAAKAIKTEGVNRSNVRSEIEKIIGRGSGHITSQMPFTPRAKWVLELSWDEAKKLSHKHIDTGHLLLGLLREGDGIAVRVLENLGADLNKLRDSVMAEQRKQATLQFTPEEDQ
jgi:ATP-dependent Clp protease ATP-binding subunit ClpC